MKNAKSNIPVKMVTQIAYANYQTGTIAICDKQSGILINAGVNNPIIKELKAGDVVNIKGYTTFGLFAPRIEVDEIVKIGSKPLPMARELKLEDLTIPKVDGDWVHLSGRLTEIKFHSEHMVIIVTLTRGQHKILILFPYSKKNEEDLKSIMFEDVKISAFASTISNNHYQLVGRFFLAHGIENIKTKPAKNDEVKDVLIKDLLTYTTNPFCEIRTHGVITAVNYDKFFIRDGWRNLKVKTFNDTSMLKPGDLVEITGVAEAREVTPALLAKDVKVIEKQEPPKPLEIAKNSEVKIDWHNNLIKIDVEIIRENESSLANDGTTHPMLICRYGDKVFDAHFPKNTIFPSNFKPGARISLVGICKVSQNLDIPWMLVLDDISLEVQSINDAHLISPAPWWTAKRIIIIVGSLLGSICLAMIWVFSLERKVTKQTKIIRTKIEHETVMSERQRIARELHDNLGQGLVALIIQVKAIIRKMDLNKKRAVTAISEMAPESNPIEKAIEELEIFAESEKGSLANLRDMLDRCSEESRSSILYLRSGLAGRLGLHTTLLEILEPLANEAKIQLQIKLIGTARALKQEIERNLMLTVKEAVTNAIRHSETKKIDVEINYGPTSLIITIRDYGCGFDINTEKVGHYGIIGMKERLKQFNAEFEIKSSSEDGTVIKIILEPTQPLEV